MMTKQRKNLQDKLRRKFGWRSERWHSGGGTTSLRKDKAANFSLRKTSTDLVVNLNPRELWNELAIGKSYNQGITIGLQQYDDSSEHPKLTKALFANITFEELELIYNIAKEKGQEAISEYMDMQSGRGCEDETK